jgi:hypothetical protein
MSSAIRFSVGVITLVLGFMAPSAHAVAGSIVRECASSRGSGQELTLYIFDGELIQLRVHTASARARAVLFQKLAVQNIPGFTVFTIPGSPAIMQIENAVLNDQRGVVEITGDSFSCL